MHATFTFVTFRGFDAFLQGLLDFAFGPMFGVSGYPDNFYVSYSCQLYYEVSW